LKTFRPHSILLVAIFALAILLALPAMADTLYDNGPINGSIDAWTINFGFEISDNFTLTGSSTLTGLSFGAWLFPGDTITSVEVSITNFEASGTTYFDQVVNLTQSNCAGNQYGFNVCTETGSFNGPVLAPGTYWLNMQNAVVPSGDPVYWDENDGVGCTSPGCPSLASNNSVGTLGSESFTLFGNTSSTTTTGTVPEPGSLVLFASGALGLAAVVRRKLF